MKKDLLEELQYLIDTLRDFIKKLKEKWRYLPWETKVRVKGVLSVLGLVLAFIIYSRSGGSISDLGKIGLLIYVLLLLGLLATTLREVLDLNTFKY